jgi:simple sugar transport system permease protein
MLATFGIINVVFAVAAPRIFLGSATYISMMTVAPLSIVLGLCLTIIVICGEIDLSFGSVAGIAALLFSSVWLSTHNPALALVTGLAGGTIAGYLNGLLVAKLKIISLVATLGTNYFWRGVILVITGGLFWSMVSTQVTWLHDALVGSIGGIPVQVFWAIGIAFLLWLILNRHSLGAHIYATGDNPGSAAMMGISVDRQRIIVFVIMGLAAGFVGIMSTVLNLSFWPTVGDGYLLPVVAAVFLGGTPMEGGTGTLFGTFVGTLILAWINTGLIAAGLTGFWTQLAYGLVIIVSLTLHRVLRRRGAKERTR